MSAPAIRLLPDGQARIFEAEPAEGDLSRLYVFDVLGLSISVYRRPDGTKVHVDESEDGPTYARPLLVEAFNSGSVAYGDDETAGQMPARG